jgi:hypothetical protein
MCNAKVLQPAFHIQRVLKRTPLRVAWSLRLA